MGKLWDFYLLHCKKSDVVVSDCSVGSTVGRFLILSYWIFFYLGFIPCKAEHPLQGMELQEKEAQKD